MKCIGLYAFSLTHIRFNEDCWYSTLASFFVIMQPDYGFRISMTDIQLIRQKMIENVIGSPKLKKSRTADPMIQVTHGMSNSGNSDNTE